MEYSIRRKPHPFWRWYADEEQPGTPLALQQLLGQRDDAAAITSHVGLDQIRDYLDPLYGGEQAWPVAVIARD
jgi:hypothetical protein